MKWNILKLLIIFHVIIVTTHFRVLISCKLWIALWILINEKWTKTCRLLLWLIPSLNIKTSLYLLSNNTRIDWFDWRSSSCRDYTAPDEIGRCPYMVISLESKRRWSWPASRYYSRSRMVKKPQAELDKVVGNLTEIRSWYVPDTILQCYRCTNLFSV
jgi:hypothetical protein